MKTNNFIQRLVARLRMPSPNDFKRIQVLCVTIGGILTGIGTTIVTTYPVYVKYGIMIGSIGGSILTIGTLIAKLTVNFDLITDEQKNKIAVSPTETTIKIPDFAGESKIETPTK
jgi:hypothetical protein